MLVRKIVATAAIVTLGVGCSSGGTGPSTGKQSINLNVATGAIGANAAAPESLSVGGHTLVFDRVELVLREIRLKRVEDEEVECPENGASGSASSSSDDDDACEYFIAGPLLLDLVLGAGPQRLVTIDVDTGSYRRVEFRIQKPEDSGDQTFVTAHPDFKKISIRVTGTYDGKAFSYTTAVNAKQKVRLATPLVVTVGAATDLTLVVDLKTWFVSGGQLVDPATASDGGRNASQVENNIRASFRLEDHSYYGGGDD